MKHAVIIVPTKTASDTRDTAASMGSITVNQRDALRAARAIDGGAKIEDGKIDMTHFDGGAAVKVIGSKLGIGGVRFAARHGVTIKYESGKTRFVQAE